MNCLILGGNGFIGSNLVDRLIADSHSVCVFDKYITRAGKQLGWQPETSLGDGIRRAWDFVRGLK